MPAAGLAADARCGHLGGGARAGLDGHAAGDGRGDCRGLRRAVLCGVAPAHHLAPPCAAGHVGLVGPGHGGMVEAVSLGRAGAGACAIWATRSSTRRLGAETQAALAAFFVPAGWF